MAHIGVLGPGGVGGVIAGRLARAGHDITVLATEGTAAAITANGLTFCTPEIDTTTVWPTARAYLTGPLDLLIVAVKANDLLPALQRVPAGQLGGATVLPLLNGVDHLPLLRATYPAASVVAATISVEATRHQPGNVEQVSTMADVEVVDGTAAGADAAALLTAAGMKVSTSPDEHAVLWRKLSFLAPFALLTTGARAPIGNARSWRGTWLRPLIDEAAAAAATFSVDIYADAIEEKLKSMPATMQSSMLKDFTAGRPLELDAIAGPVLRALGTEKAPTTTEVVRTILKGR